MAEWRKMTAEIKEVLERAPRPNCICKQKPCVCHNGWGTFDNEGDLLSAISSEIGRESWRLEERQGYNLEVVEWMYTVHELSATEIAEDLRKPLREIERILRELGHEIVF